MDKDLFVPLCALIFNFCRKFITIKNAISLIIVEVRPAGGHRHNAEAAAKEP